MKSRASWGHGSCGLSNSRSKSILGREIQGQGIPERSPCGQTCWRPISSYGMSPVCPSPNLVCKCLQRPCVLARRAITRLGW